MEPWDKTIVLSDTVLWMSSHNLFRVVKITRTYAEQYDYELKDGFKIGDEKVPILLLEKICNRYGKRSSGTIVLPATSVVKVDSEYMEKYIRTLIDKLENSLPKFKPIFAHEARLRKAKVLI